MGRGDFCHTAPGWDQFAAMGIWIGLMAYLDALALVQRHRLWIYFLVPALVSLLLVLGLGWLGWNLTAAGVGGLLSWLPDWLSASWAGPALQGIGLVLLGLAFLLVFRNLVLALCGPFMSMLSETLERRLGGHRDRPFQLTAFLSDLWRGLRIALRLLLRELFFTSLLLALGLIPLFTPVVPALIFIVQAYYAGAGNLDFTLERYYGVRESIRFTRRHRGLAIGNGIGYLLLLLTGIGFLFALPLATIAATPPTLKRIATQPPSA